MPSVAADHPVIARKIHDLRLKVPDDIYQELNTQKSRFQSVPQFVLEILDSYLRGTLEFPKNSLRKEEDTPVDPEKRVDDHNTIKVTPDHLREKRTAVTAVLEEKNLHIKDKSSRGDSELAERGCSDDISNLAESVPAKKGQSNLIPPNLYCHSELIKEYWKIKPKGKTPRCWTFLMGQLTKIQEHGDAELEEQLLLAINGKFQGITYKNYLRFNSSVMQSGQARNKKPTLVEQFKDLGYDFS